MESVNKLVFLSFANHIFSPIAERKKRGRAREREREGENENMNWQPER